MQTASPATPDRVSHIIQAAFAPGSGHAARQVAQETCDQLKLQPGGHNVAYTLLSTGSSPEVRHVGYHVLLAILRSRPAVLNDTDRAEVRAWITDLLSSTDWAVAPAHLRGKCAETVAELACLDWPSNWPSLAQALKAACLSPSMGNAALGLSIWRHLAELLLHDSKELNPQRRAALSTALTKVMEEPNESPVLVESLEEALKAHGAQKGVVREALGLCKSLAAAVPVLQLLRRNLDRIVFVGLADPDLRESSVLALADWVEQLLPEKGKSMPNIDAVADLCRFTSALAQVAQKCLYDPNDMASFAFHRQIAQVFADLCTAHAQRFVQLLQVAELGMMWQALFHLLRYPSWHVQLEALMAMHQLVRGQGLRDKMQSPYVSPPAPPLQDVSRVLYVNMIKAGLYKPDDLDEQRSKWLMHLLGKVAVVELPGQSSVNFRDWQSMISQAFELDESGSTGGSNNRAQVFSEVKLHTLELLGAITLANQSCSIEAYLGLLRISAVLMQRALGGSIPMQDVFTAASSSQAGSSVQPWWPEFDAAVSLVERLATSMLRSAQQAEAAQKPEGGLAASFSVDSVVAPTMDFLQAALSWCPGAASERTETSVNVQCRQLALVANWAPFYKRSKQSAEHIAQVLQRLLSVLERCEKGSAIQHRAIDTLLALAKSGAMTPAQIEVLNAECERLLPRLSGGAAGKFCEVIASAVATVDMDLAQKVATIEKVMAPVTQTWKSNPFTQTMSPEAFLSLVVGSQGLELMKNARTALSTFHGLANTLLHDDKEEQRTKEGLVARLVQVWAPGVFALLVNLAGVEARGVAVAAGLATGNLMSSSADHQITAALVATPIKQELAQMLGKESTNLDATSEPAATQPVVDERVISLQVPLWQLRVLIVKVAFSLVRFDAFWSMSNSMEMVQVVTAAVENHRPHWSSILIRDLIGPILQCQKVHLPPDMHSSAACAILPALAKSIARSLQELWGGSSAASMKGFWAASQASPMHEAALAASTGMLTRTSARFLAALVGADSPNAKQVPFSETWFEEGRSRYPQAQLDKQVEPAAVPQRAGKSKKNRNRNRFAALAEDLSDLQNNESNQHAVDSSSDAIPSAPSESSARLFKDPRLREVVRAALVEMLQFPQAEAVRASLSGLHAWCAQLWGSLLRGEGEAFAALDRGRSAAPPLATFLHVAADALRTLPCGVLKPILALVASPPDCTSSGKSEMAPADASEPPDQFVAKSEVQRPLQVPSALSITVAQPWQQFLDCRSTGGKSSASQLVSFATPVVCANLHILTSLFKLQCLRLQQTPSAANIQTCGPLLEALQVLRALPNTSEADITTVLGTFLINGSDSEQAVRVLLHEASSSFNQLAAAG